MPIIRFTGIILATTAAVIFYLAQDITSGFGEVVGPSYFPKLMAVVLFVLSLLLIATPSEKLNIDFSTSVFLRQASLVVLLTLFAMLIKPIGFIYSATMASILLLKLFAANWRQSLLFGLLLSLSLYLLFEYALGISLPDMPTTAELEQNIQQVNPFSSSE